MRTSKKTIALLAGAALATLSLGALAACNDEEHTLSLIEEQAATCTQAGHEAYYLCSHCGKLFADENAETEVSDADVTIAALGHEMTHHEAVAATCTEDGNLEYWSCSRCELNFSDAEGTKEIASVAIPAGHDIGWVELVEPTASAEGMLAHYECSVCHTCFEDAYGEKELDKAELVLEKLTSQDISVKVEVYDTAGNLVASPDYAALGRVLVLKGEYSSNRYDDLAIGSDGTLSLTSAVVGKYEVDLYGYARSVFTVEEGRSEYTLKLSMTIAYGSNDKVTVNDAEGSVSIAAQDMSANMWTGSAELILPAGIENNFFVFETTLKMGDFEDGWTTGGTQQRYAIQLTEQNTGFYFWSWTAEGASKTFVRRFAVNNLNNAMTENAVVNGDEAANGYMTDALRSDSGLPIRILRLDGEFVLLVMKDGAWNEVGRMEVESDSPAKIVLYGVEASYTWSGFGISELKFVPAAEATAEEPGNYAYYTDGTRFWFEDGEETTAEGVKIYAPVSVTLTVNGIALDGTTAATVPEGTLITFTGRANTYTYTVGGEAISEMIAGDYTVTAEGYASVSITVPAEGGTIELTLQKVITIGKGAEVLVNNAWNGQQTIAVPETVTGDFLLEMTLKMYDFTQGFNDLGAWQRYAIRLTEGNAGFYFWSWNDGTAKTRIRQFSEENRTNAAKENEDVNGDEAGIGFITNELLDADGLQLRILRAGNTFYLYALNGSEWVKLGSVECEEGDKLDMEVYAGVGTYEWSNVNFSEVTYVPEKAPTTEDGNVAYYTDGENYWLADGTITTEDGVVLLYEVAVEVIVEGVALDGTTAETVADGTVITFTSSKTSYTYTVGEAQAFRMSPDTYIVTADGCRAVEITVPEEGGKIELTLQKVITIAGAVSDYNPGNKWSGSVTLEISDDLKASTAVILEFTVKNVTNSAAGWPTDEWASQRFAIQMAKGNEGFLFFLPKGEANIFDMTDGSIRDEGKTKFNGDFVWIDTLIRGENGVNMRIVRTGANVTLFVQNGEGEWVKIGTVACGEAETEIVFYGCGVEWEFSSVTVGTLDYVAEKQPEADAHGNVAYYTDGENYWLADGSSATKEDVMLYVPIDVTFTVEGVALDGTTAETVAEGTVITFTSSKSTYTYVVGETQSFKMSPDTYIVTVDGCRAVEITVPEEGGKIELTLQKVITIGKGAEVLVNNAWNGQQTIAVPETVTGDFLLEMTLKMYDFTQGFNDLGAWQRYAIRLTEGSAGFYFWSWNDGTAKTRIRQFSEENRTNAAKENADVNGDEAGIGFITNELLDADGLQLRILRAGNTFYLYALNGSDWVKLGSVTCAEGDKLDMEVYAGVGTYEWSNIHFAEISFVAEKAPVVGGSDGNVAYYTDGENYWLTDGTPATAEDVVLSAVEVKLTVNGTALDGTTSETVADGTIITLTGDYGSYSFKVGEAAPAEMLAGTYVVTAEGYAQTTLVIPKDGGDLILTLKEAVTIGKGAEVLVNNAWNGQQTIAVPEGLTDGDFVFEATLKMHDFTQGWNDFGAWQRYAIRLTEGNAGFYFWSWNDGTAKTHIRQFSEENRTNAAKENADVNADEAGLGYITNALVSEDGLQIRITREGTTFTLEVMNGAAWATLGTVTCSADDVADIELYAGVGTYEWTNITVTPAAQE